MNIVTTSSYQDSQSAYLEFEYDGLTITTQRPLRAKQGTEFLPSEVRDSGVIVWQYSWKTMLRAYLREYEGELIFVIAFKEHGRFAVVFVEDLPGQVEQNPDFYDELSCALAGSLGTKINLVSEPSEAPDMIPLQGVDILLDEIGDEGHAADRVEQPATDAYAKQSEILNRPLVGGYNENNQAVFGHPVIGDEWMFLPNETKCVPVTSLDPKKILVMRSFDVFTVKRFGKSGLVRDKASRLTKERKKRWSRQER